MFKAWKYVRWFALLIALCVEGLAFWFGHSGTLLDKLTSASSWTLTGFTALTVTWFFLEVSLHLFRNGRRVRRELMEDERIVHETGLHWLVLKRNIYQHPAAWRFIYIPLWCAIITTLYFVGYAAWIVASFPADVSAWAQASQESLGHLSGVWAIFATPLVWILGVLPESLRFVQAIAFEHIWLALGVVFAAWYVLHHVQKFVRWFHLPHVLVRPAHWMQWGLLLLAIFIVATQGLAWLTPIYTFLPHQGPVAMGYFPLTFSLPFFIPHIAEWRSKRFALFQDATSFSAALLICNGIFDYDRERISLQRIVDTKVHQKWWKRLVRAGDITLIETGGGKEGELLEDIWGPRELDNKIYACIHARDMHQPVAASVD